MVEFLIGDRKIGTGHPALIIAEVAQAHEGSLNFAHSFIDAAAGAGADAIKFQTHIAAEESSPADQWRVRFSRQDASRFEYWKRMEFTKQQWAGLKEHAESKGLIFLSSPFSLAAVELLAELRVQGWKIASGEVRNELLLEKIMATRLPVLLSSGMSSWEEMEATVRKLKAAEIACLVMQCTSAYPCPPERVGLNIVAEIQARLRCEAGISDHSGTIWPALAAIVLGAKAVELHVTWDRTMFGPDAAASVTFGELKQLVEGVRFTERMLASPVDKAEEASKLGEMRRLFGQSLVAANDLPAGTILESRHLSTRKPQAGISASEFSTLAGKRLRRSLRKGEFLQRTDIEE